MKTSLMRDRRRPSSRTRIARLLPHPAVLIQSKVAQAVIAPGQIQQTGPIGQRYPMVALTKAKSGTGNIFFIQLKIENSIESHIQQFHEKKNSMGTTNHSKDPRKAGNTTLSTPANQSPGIVMVDAGQGTGKITWGVTARTPEHTRPTRKSIVFYSKKKYSKV